MPQLTIDWQYTKCFYELQRSKDSVLILVGGKRSGKSYSAIQFLILKFLTGRNKKILITRKTGPALRVTAYKTLVDLLKEIGIYKYVGHNKSFLEFTFNSNYLLCTSIDDEEKVRSTEWSDIFMEEANNFVYDDYQTLKLQMSAPKAQGEINQLIIAINPTEMHGWVNKQLIRGQHHPIIHSTYRDNPFLDSDYIKELEKLKQQDEAYWKVYGLGIFAEMAELIYKPFIELESYPEAMDETVYGLDFGFNNPTALVELGIKDQRNIYPRELLYETGLTTNDLVGKIKELNISPSAYIYCDSSEPDRIEELRRNGFYAVGSHKGKNSVKDGIDFMKSLTIHTLKQNVNLNNERASYTWKKDKSDNIFDEPVKWDDHLLDATRYACYTHLAQRLEPAIYVL